MLVVQFTHHNHSTPQLSIALTGFVQPGPTFPDDEGEDDDMDLGGLYGEEEEEEVGLGEIGLVLII